MFEELYLTGNELTTRHPDILTVPRGDLGVTDSINPELLGRIDSTANGISVGFVADPSLESSATNADQQLAVGRGDQVGEVSGHFILLGRPGFPSPQSGSCANPQHTCPVLRQAPN